MKSKLNYKEFGEHAVLVEWPSEIKEEILSDILSFEEKVNTHFKDDNLELIPSYNTLVIVDNAKKLKSSKLIEKLSSFHFDDQKRSGLTGVLWELPVCYDESFALDMSLLCQEKQLTPDEIISLHSAAIYTVYSIGFLPGFMYLGGLPEVLITKRRAEPRLKVPAGAVGIGGNQTGIYPQQSPGGWNLIGNSPVKLFDISKDSPCFVSVGDQIKFYPISKPEYEILEIQVQTGLFQPVKKERND